MVSPTPTVLFLTFGCLWRLPRSRSPAVACTLVSFIASVLEKVSHMGVVGSRSVVDLGKNPDFCDIHRIGASLL